MRGTLSARSGEKRGYIPVKNALLDLLREQGLSINDLLEAMRLENIDVYNELKKRLLYRDRMVEVFIESLNWRGAAILLFAVQALYIINPAGIYKGYLIIPLHDQVVFKDKILPHGLIILAKSLNQLI